MHDSHIPVCYIFKGESSKKTRRRSLINKSTTGGGCKMRKYQQLFLVIISFISISVLLIYKSENNRLKYVLQVVNFFGRNDATILSRLENVTKHDIFTDFSNPLPVWQRVSDDFYVYSAFWEEFDSSLGSDVIAIAVGRRDATMQFMCSVRRENGSDIKGTFLFMPVGLHDNDEKKDDEQFVLFKFKCKIAQQLNILPESPKTLILTEVKTGREQEIILRIVRPIGDESKVSTASMVVCLNIVPYKSWKINNFFLNRNLMQFFMHHKIIGIEEFLIYNGDLIPLEVKKMLSKAGMHVHYFPFNFPFSYNTIQTRAVVEMDCLMRTAGSSKYAILLEPNKFFYPNTNMHLKDSVIASLSDYADHNHFELATFSVCLDHKNKLLVDNHFHDTGNNIGHKIYISKSTLHPQNGQNMTLPISKAFVHNYINCISSKGLWDWRNAIRKDFMQYILTIRNEMSFLF